MSISLGDISFGIGPNTQRLSTAISQVQAFGRAVSNAARATADGARQAEAQLRKQEAAVVSALMKVQNLQDRLTRANAPNSFMANTTRSLEAFTRHMTSGQLSALQFQRGMERFNVSINNTTRRLNDHIDTQRKQANATQEQVAATRRQEQALLREEAAYFKATQAVLRFEQAQQRAGATGKLQLGVNPRQSLANLSQTLSNPGIGRVDQQRAIQNFSSSMDLANSKLRDFIASRSKLSDGVLEQTLQKITAATVLLTGPLSGVASRVSVLSHLGTEFGLAWAGALGGIAAATFSVYKIGSAVIDTERKLQSMEAILTAVFNSQVIAQTQLKQVSSVANRAGVDILSTAKAYSQLSAAAKGTSLEGERTMQIFEAITFAGAKLGLSQQDVEGALRAVQQIMSKGTVQAEELRGQLGDRLPGAMQIMAAALGVTTQKLDGMLKKGSVGASVLAKFAEELKKRYNIDTAQNIDTIVAAENRFSNALTTLNDQLDKTIGFSAAYKNVLNALTSGTQWITGNITVLSTAIGAAAGALVYLFSPAMINTILGVGRAIVTVTTAMWALNTATTAHPIGGLLSILVRIGVATLGAVTGMAVMKNMLGDTGSTYLRVLPQVEEYINAQSKLKTTVRATTQEYINQQEAFVTDQMTAVRLAEAKVAKLKEEAEKTESLGQIYDETGQAAISFATQQYIVASRLDDATKSVKEQQAALEQAQKNIIKLRNILTQQTAEETKPRKDPDKDPTNRQQLALKNALDTIRELQAQYDTLYKAPAAKEFAQTQNEINKQVENFRDSLTRAELPVAKIKELTDQYASTLTKLKYGELNVKNLVSSFQMLEGVFSRGLDQGLTEFIGVIFEGKSALEALRNTAKFVAEDIFKTFMQLALLNPLKNMLFGTSYQTFGGLGGIGGLLGSFFGGGGGNPVNVGSTTGFAKGGIMTSMGPLPLRTYSTGGIATRPQLALHGEGSQNEAYVPLPDGRSIPVIMQGGATQPIMIESHVHFHGESASKDNVALQQRIFRKTLEDVVDQRIVKAMSPRGMANRSL